MNDSTLLRISFILSLAGIILLWVTARNIELGSELKLGSRVEITGEITRITESEKTLFIRIDSYDIVVFKNGILKLREGQNVAIIGKVAEYKNRKEIIADRIKVY